MPEVDILGDLQKIRNDLVKHRRVASKRNCGRCTILKWFKANDEIILSFSHVLDFLNHMSLLTPNPVIHPDRTRGCRWEFLYDEEVTRSHQPPPRVVSVRLMESDVEPPPGQLSIGASIAFDNGLYGLLEFNEPSAEARNVQTAAPDSAGDMRYNGGGVRLASDLYLSCVLNRFHPEAGFDMNVQGVDFYIRGQQLQEAAKATAKAEEERAQAETPEDSPPAERESGKQRSKGPKPTNLTQT